MGGIRWHVVTSYGTGNRSWCEKCGLKHYRPGCVRNHRGHTAFNTGKCDRSTIVRDNQIFWFQANSHTIKKFEPLAFDRCTYGNSALKALGIERVHWLTEFKHDVVADIH